MNDLKCKRILSLLSLASTDIKLKKSTYKQCITRIKSILDFNVPTSVLKTMLKNEVEGKYRENKVILAYRFNTYIE